MKQWKRFLDMLFALVTSPGFSDLDPDEQDRLYAQVARAARVERLLAKSRPPHRFYTSALRQRWRPPNHLRASE
jgi:hypothetical protein